ncbi:hypothetical protein KQX54_021573 [Cotesia glomerata]|uniref:Uncharacterized protein n=1 Tax=Cotesia glomerata TaxID=32391 RepID=A0AAV7J986_COTGL|nr:hypothetical protein KQX54_021573 [Cotesia glomerata]
MQYNVCCDSMQKQNQTHSQHYHYHRHLCRLASSAWLLAAVTPSLFSFCDCFCLYKQCEPITVLEDVQLLRLSLTCWSAVNSWETKPTETITLAHGCLEKLPIEARLKPKTLRSREAADTDTDVKIKVNSNNFKVFARLTTDLIFFKMSIEFREYFPNNSQSQYLSHEPYNSTNRIQNSFTGCNKSNFNDKSLIPPSKSRKLYEFLQSHLLNVRIFKQLNTLRHKTIEHSQRNRVNGCKCDGDLMGNNDRKYISGKIRTEMTIEKLENRMEKTAESTGSDAIDVDAPADADERQK